MVHEDIMLHIGQITLEFLNHALFCSTFCVFISNNGGWYFASYTFEQPTNRVKKIQWEIINKHGIIFYESIIICGAQIFVDFLVILKHEIKTPMQYKFAIEMNSRKFKNPQTKDLSAIHKSWYPQIKCFHSILKFLIMQRNM